MAYEWLFLQSLALTIFVETIVLWLLLNYGHRSWLHDISLGDILFLGVTCSLTTLPYLWFVLPFFIKQYIVLIIFGEILIVIIETVLITFILKISLPKSLWLSLICNSSSMLTGLIIS